MDRNETPALAYPDQVLAWSGNGFADALSREEWRSETGSQDGIQSGVGVCEGPALTREEERQEEHPGGKPEQEVPGNKQQHEQRNT